MRRITMLAPCAAALGLLAACATTMPPPSELVAARAEYARAETGPAGKLQPAKVYEAKKALDRAEAEFQKQGDAQSTRDLAYVAQRKAQYAEVQAGIAQAEQTLAAADAEMRRMTGEALLHYRERVAQQRSELERQRVETQTARAEAEQERAARAEAEKRIQQALADLGKLASMREEARGTVITLTGSVLFRFNSADLLPTAMTRLTEVADALKSEPDRTITIEGHTDNVGSVDVNLDLSRRRAERVRDYLVGRGIDPARVTAVGKGEANPIATNATPEGRANNRRVEIILSQPRSSEKR
jgi:outer membrane protein OmpA-like peptidoglycan-associated protein